MLMADPWIFGAMLAWVLRLDAPRRVIAQAPRKSGRPFPSVRFVNRDRFRAGQQLPTAVSPSVLIARGPRLVRRFHWYSCSSPRRAKVHTSAHAEKRHSALL